MGRGVNVHRRAGKEAAGPREGGPHGPGSAELGGPAELSLVLEALPSWPSW